ncbi:MAG: PaaI family thioesterase [Rhodospirillaceae bacterium]|nr:PaaI family thioesterase [Rhodospirillaceae bacterium]
MAAALSTTPYITPAAFNRAINAYPWFGQWMGVEATEIDADGATVRMPVRPEFLRHGGTVSGPIVMAVADVAMYAAIMGAVANGESAVTSDMTLHFMRRPVGAALVGKARILRRGRRSIVCSVDVFVEGESASVCHIVGSYAVPRT